jgi:RNA polymerase sigma-70 factor (sigma-E family)
MDTEASVASRAAPDFESYMHARLPHLIKFGCALTADEHAAADLVQDALARVLVRWSRVHGDPEPYIRRTMVNRSISIWRKLGREIVTDRVPDLPVEGSGHDEALFAALRHLPARQRAVIALRYLEDLTEAETARVLGCAVGTVKSQSNSALATLRRLLDEEDGS